MEELNTMRTVVKWTARGLLTVVVGAILLWLVAWIAAGV
jgi:hypothetical protein